MVVFRNIVMACLGMLSSYRDLDHHEHDRFTGTAFSHNSASTWSLLQLRLDQDRTIHCFWFDVWCVK